MIAGRWTTISKEMLRLASQRSRRSFANEKCEMENEKWDLIPTLLPCGYAGPSCKGTFSPDELDLRIGGASRRLA